MHCKDYLTVLVSHSPHTRMATFKKKSNSLGVLPKGEHKLLTWWVSRRKRGKKSLAGFFFLFMFFPLLPFSIGVVRVQHRPCTKKEWHCCLHRVLKGNDIPRGTDYCGQGFWSLSLCFPVKSETNLSLQYLNVLMYSLDRIFSIGFLVAISYLWFAVC